MDITTNAFKFLALRPVQKLDRTREQLRFLKVPDFVEPPTQFQNQIYHTPSRDAALDAARGFITSPAYLRDPALVPAAQPFVLLHAALVEAVRTGDLTALRRAAQEAPGPEAREQLRNRVWDSLIAAFLAPRVLPHDRGELVAVLRALHLAEIVDELRSDDDLRDLAGATPVIPSWAWKDEDGDPSPGTQHAEPAQVPLGQVNQMRREIAGIDDALDDVERAYLQVIRELHAAGHARRPPSQVPASEAPDRPTPTPTADTGRPPWETATRVAGRLAPETRALLDRIDRAWHLRPATTASEKLARHRELLYRRLEQVGGRAATIGLGTRTTPAARPAIDLEHLPVPGGATQVQQAVGVDWTKTVEGSVGTVRPVGYGDLLVIEDTLLGYTEGEISLVENVMRSESRQRVHRRLDKLVQQTFTATEQTEETERDLQSTERYELQSEASETFSNEMSISTGVDISGSYGPVSVAASADFAVSNSTEQSQSTSSTFAQDLVDRTVSRISQRVKEEVTTTVTTETEEVNTHGFDNAEGTEHAVGVYRWLDKYHQGQVKNYGKRLMFEMVVPEPSSFYKYAKSQPDPALQPPEPLEEGFSFEDITPANYDKWVDRYQVSGVEPPPPLTKVVAKMIEMPESAHGKTPDDYQLMTRMDSLIIPAGYTATEAWTRVGVEFWGNRSYYAFGVIVGAQYIDKLAGDDAAVLDGEIDQLPIGVITYEVQACVVAVEALCTRTAANLNAWKLATFEKIVEAYNTRLSAYEAARDATQTSQASVLGTLPPEAKRAIEQTELKKGCLELFTNQYFYDFESTRDSVEPFGYPEFGVGEAMREAPYIQFLELCLEWPNMTYIFYPYFWGRKAQWAQNSGQTDGDPVFESFLRAGAARVLVPVRPNYEKTVCYYLQSGEIWNGGDVPVLEDELYVSIADEIAASQDVSLDDAVPYGKPWTYRLPTSLVKLQADATLPRWQPPAS